MRLKKAFCFCAGFGHLLSLRLDQRGYKVFAGCLLPDGLGAQELRAQGSSGLHVMPVDVTAESSVDAANDYIRANLGDHGMYII